MGLTQNLTKIQSYKSFLSLFSALATTITLLDRSALVLRTASTGQVVTTRSPVHTTYSSILHTSTRKMETIVATASLSVALPARATFAELSSAPRTKITPVMG